MAKAKVRGLEDEINRVFKRYEDALTKAMKYAADEAEFDIGFRARGCLDEYYENYGPNPDGEPNWYERTHNLINAFVSINEVNNVNGEIVARAGVIYDPAKLDGVYSSNASEKYQPVDSEWILRNYLQGIHPRTNGYPIWADELVYDPYIDTVSPDTKMRDYIEKYKTTFDQNVLKSFAKQVARR